jgi:hypothetical protein
MGFSVGRQLCDASGHPSALAAFGLRSWRLPESYVDSIVSVPLLLFNKWWFLKMINRWVNVRKV